MFDVRKIAKVFRLLALFLCVGGLVGLAVPALASNVPAEPGRVAWGGDLVPAGLQRIGVAELAPADDGAPVDDVAPAPVATVAPAGDIRDSRGALLWVIAGGASVLASFLFDRTKWLDSMDTGLRMAVVGLASIVITTAARLLLQFVPPDWFAAFDVYFVDWLPYIGGLSAIYATKALRTGFEKARVTVALSRNVFNS